MYQKRPSGLLHFFAWADDRKAGWGWVGSVEPLTPKLEVKGSSIYKAEACLLTHQKSGYSGFLGSKSLYKTF